MFKKHDMIIYAAILLLAAAAFLFYSRLHSSKGDSVVVSVDNTVIMTLPLDEPFDADIAGYDSHITDTGTLSGYCHLKINNGYADVTEATCPDLICEKHRPISRQGEAIICLPNRIVIEVISSEDGIDAVSE